MQQQSYSLSCIPTLPQILHERAHQLGATPYIYVDGQPVLSWAEYADAVFSLAVGLREQGLKPGQRVTIFSDNSVDWLKVQLAIFAAGLISVPLLPANSDAMLAGILQHAEPQALFVDVALLPRVTTLQQQTRIPDLLVTMNGKQESFNSLHDISLGASEEAIQQLLAGITAKTPASLAYTSGSTGDPKGVLKHHAASVVNHGFCDANGNLLAPQPEITAGLILSLNHGMGQALFNRSLVRGYSLALTGCPEADIRLANIAVLQPSILWVVPRVIKRLVEEFDTTHSEWLMAWNELNNAVKQDDTAMADLQRAMQQAFGGKLAEIHSAGSPTPPTLLKRFATLSLPLYEFYGSTETGTITVGSAGGVPGMTGLPLPGIEVRLDTDSELLVRGPGVSLGYFRDAKATAEIMDADGWCRTGDLAIIKPEGLQITGRKKDIFNTSEGSNMYPSRVEGALEELALVAQAVLLGDRRPFIAALIVPDVAKAEQELGRALTVSDYHNGGELHRAVMRGISRTNTFLEPYEQVQKVFLLNAAFPPTIRTQVGGVGKTRIRRDLVEQFYAIEIQQIYEVV
jgi:long-chain acyl-CoA synthetase